MNTGLKISIALLLTALTIAGCASSEAKRDPYNDADSQRDRARQAQDELSRDTAK